MDALCASSAALARVSSLCWCSRARHGLAHRKHRTNVNRERNEHKITWRSQTGDGSVGGRWAAQRSSAGAALGNLDLLLHNDGVGHANIGSFAQRHGDHLRAGRRLLKRRCIRVVIYSLRHVCGENRFITSLRTRTRIHSSRGATPRVRAAFLHYGRAPLVNLHRQTYRPHCCTPRAGKAHARAGETCLSPHFRRVHRLTDVLPHQ